MRRLILLFALSCPLAAQDAPPPPPPPPTPPSWISSLGAGLAITSGNSDTQSINFAFSTAWDPKTDRLFKAEALYLRGETEGVVTVDKVTAAARYDRSISAKTFLFTEASFLRDPFKDIDYFLAPLVGVGRYLLKDEAQILRIDGAAGGVFESNEVLGRSTSAAVKAGQSYERSLSPTSRLTQQVSGIWKVEDFDDAAYHFDAGLAPAVTTRTELKVAYAYDYRTQVSSPAIEKGDSSFFATFLFKF